MDPITHTLTGAALSRAGLRQTTPLATAALVAGANAPDIDGLIYLTGAGYQALALRRGWTHGPLAVALLPFAVAGLVLAYDRWLRRRRSPEQPPARWWPLLLLSFLGVLTHPVLDWLNTYGIRLLMPFSRQWFYGDALFIVDPWVWLLLGGALFLTGRARLQTTLAWALLGGLLTLLVLTAPIPVAAKVVWSAGLAALAAARGMAARTRRQPSLRFVQVAVVLAALYILGMIGASAAARRQVRHALPHLPVERVMVAPTPANPFTGEVVVATPTAYHLGAFHWLGTPRLRLSGDTIPLRPSGHDQVIAAAAADPDARAYLTWSRFPFFQVQESADGYTVFIGDARYTAMGRAGELSGIRVRVGRDLRPIEDRGTAASRAR